MLTDAPVILLRFVPLDDIEISEALYEREYNNYKPRRIVFSN